MCEWRNHPELEVAETAGPGALKPNVRRVYKDIGEGENRHKVLVCREIDTNLDGIKDVMRAFNAKGEAQKENADTNFDGKLDVWTIFVNGRMSEENIDTNFDGAPDVWKVYVDGKLSRIKRDRNFDGKPDVWEIYTNGHLERMGLDDTFDGHVDRWDRDEQMRMEAEEQEAKARDADGRRLDGGPTRSRRTGKKKVRRPGKTAARSSLGADVARSAKAAGNALSTDRLQKILARGGYASRRAAERIIAEGRVRVNGRVVTELGSKADPYKDKVEVNGVRVVAERAVYVVLHKPRGVVTTMSDPEGRPSIREILAPIGARVYPVGRLDFATSGVLLATNDGDFAEGMMHPKKAVPKTYVVKVAGVMQTRDLDRWREGIRLEDGVTLAAKVSFLRHEADKTWFELTIREGRNQQIRRMGEATGFTVMRLARLSFAGITAEGLRPGAWRFLAPDELKTLKKEYGVPKRIVDAEMRPTGRTRPRKAAMKTARERRTAAEREARARPSDRERARTRRREPERPSARADKRPRYGGGLARSARLRRARDWGGGAGARSGPDDRARSMPTRGSRRRGPRRSGRPLGGAIGDEMPRGDVGGRSGQSRTTGTGGGIGASGGDYRVKGRSGRAK